jgi:predicted DNA-binding ribbon-helix-helix protein
MEPAEYKRLQELAEREGLSVAELVRRAVTERYFLPAGQERKQKALQTLFALHPVPVGDWDAMKRELSERYGAHPP